MSNFAELDTDTKAGTGTGTAAAASGATAANPTNWICQTCGTQYPAAPCPPQACPICQDERQYIGHAGQRWTSLQQLRQSGHMNAFRQEEPGLIGIGTVPEVGIGQRALLVRTPEGNILWDCLSYIDEVTEDIVRGFGGIQAIAISHPHYYSSMVEWAERFDCEIYLHEGDRAHVMRPSPRIVFWSGSRRQLTTTVQLVHVGGHFAGGTVLHWDPDTTAAADASRSGTSAHPSEAAPPQPGPVAHPSAPESGVILSGDILQVAADRDWVSFMYSYPNDIPLPAREIKRIRGIVEGLRFERLYGFQWGSVIANQARDKVLKSADRYLRALS